MNGMARVVCEWFAKSLESVLSEAIDNGDPNIVSFCRNKIYPIYGTAIDNSEGMIKRNEKLVYGFEKKRSIKMRELAFESETEVEKYLEVMR
jgi:hypothetical protein